MTVSFRGLLHLLPAVQTDSFMEEKAVISVCLFLLLVGLSRQEVT